MRVITPGHRYEVQNFEAPGGQTLQFIHKEPIPGQPGKLRTVADGTTNEELLAVLLDRLKYLNGKFPCRENELAIVSVEIALHALNERTARRKAAGVEGTNLPIPVTQPAPTTSTPDPNAGATLPPTQPETTSGPTNSAPESPASVTGPDGTGVSTGTTPAQEPAQGPTPAAPEATAEAQTATSEPQTASPAPEAEPEHVDTAAAPAEQPAEPAPASQG